MIFCNYFQVLIQLGSLNKWLLILLFNPWFHVSGKQISLKGIVSMKTSMLCLRKYFAKVYIA